jgi:hypothetical protein
VAGMNRNHWPESSEICTYEIIEQVMGGLGA